MKPADGMWFEASFYCAGCAAQGQQRVMTVRNYRAVVFGPGIEVGCKECRTVYIVTSDGATPLSSEDVEQLPTTVEGESHGNTQSN